MTPSLGGSTHIVGAGHRQVGSLRVAYTKERQEEFNKMLSVCEKVRCSRLTRVPVQFSGLICACVSCRVVSCRVVHQAGLHVETLSPKAAQKMWPGMNFEKATHVRQAQLVRACPEAPSCAQ